MSPRRHAALIVAAFCAAGAAAGFAQVIAWTGAGPNNNWTVGANWEGGAAPASNADVLFSSMRQYLVSLNGSRSVNAVTTDSEYHEFDTRGGATLTIGAGGLMANGNTARFDSSATINLGAAQTWYVNGNFTTGGHDGELRVDGVVTGANLAKSGDGRLILNGNNSLTGTFTLHQGYLRLGSNDALGRATFIVDDTGNGSDIETAAGNRTLANAVQINSGCQLNTDKGGLTLSGSVTLLTSPTVSIIGPSPVVFSGPLGESGGSRTFTLAGSGKLQVQGAVNTTGGLSVTGGQLVFDTGATLPASGFLTVAYPGYIGTSLATGVQKGFIDRFAKSASDGALGFEGGTTITDAINLTSFNASARLGSSSTAALEGAITPQGASYNFGGGGGLLKIGANLGDGDGAGLRSLSLVSSADAPLSLVLAGANDYSGGTVVNTSLLRFTSAGALPSAGQIAINNRGYVGFEYDQDLAKLSPRITNAGTLILGFDSPSAPRTVATPIDLAPYGAGTPYLGTSTALILSGSITPAGGAAAPWQFAAVKGGVLTVASSLAGPAGVTVGVPFESTGDAFADGYVGGTPSTVRLTGTNTYGGGTTLQSGRLELGNAGALGTGTLTVYNSTLATTTASLVIANPLVNQTNGDSDGFYLDGTNSFTLSGGITGHGTLYKDGAGSVSLTGPVSLPNFVREVTYRSDVRVRQGTLDIANTFSAGGQLDLYDGTTVKIGPAVAASVGELKTDTSPGGNGIVDLGDGSTLTINSLNGTDDPYFSGAITGSGSIVKAGSGIQYLGALPGPSTSTYSGGTTITGGAIIALSDGALGTGPVTLNATGPAAGGLGVYTGVTLTNPLTFTSGVLGGFGTFAPPGGVTVGIARILWPGNLFDSDPVGTLGFGTGLTLATGGTYRWEITKAVGSPGLNWDQLLVTGSLTITSTSAGPFVIQVASVDPAYRHGSGGSVSSGAASSYLLPDFDNALAYSWMIASATGVTGFDPNAFTLDTTSFGNSLGIGSFFLSRSSDDLLLNFTPVPEPSTCALLGTGLLILVARSLRRRRG